MSFSPSPDQFDRVVLRNAACPCESGLRYKHCCGLAAHGTMSASVHRERKREAGLMLQRRGDFARAIEIYDAVLRAQHEDWDIAHMRATCYFQLGALDEAGAAFAALLDTPARHLPGFWANLGLVLASICPDHASPSLRERLEAYRRFRPGQQPVPASVESRQPTVSVVLPTYMHADYAGEAIASVIAQTRAPLELIVIDDGSRDATVDHCRAALLDAPFPVRLIAREHRGAAATLNQGIDLAEGEFIQLLNADDRLPPQRIATMLAALLRDNAEWGYARVALVDGHGRALGPRADERAATLMAAQDAALMSPTLGLALLRANSAISSGNLMLRKRLWQTLGGFRDFHYNHDWDFCLRAALECEPVLVAQPLYEYRIHGRKAISEARVAARDEQQHILAAFVTHAHGRSGWPNPFAPTLGIWGGEVLALLGAIDALRYLPRAAIEHALASSLSTPIGG